MNKGAAHFPEVVGRRRMLKNNSAGLLLFWKHGIFH